MQKIFNLARQAPSAQEHLNVTYVITEHQRDYATFTSALRNLFDVIDSDYKTDEEQLVAIHGAKRRLVSSYNRHLQYV